jgi:hypothetical protein
VERRKGIPRTDVERAVAHYGITEAEYCEHPGKYPLPTRGYGLETGRAAGTTEGSSMPSWGWWLIGGVGVGIVAVIAYVAAKR